MSDQINDFVVKIANVNGTGSASANGMLMKSIFRMGIPVVGKNFFPSNIQGLPTWYEIRISKQGYLSRSGNVDMMIAMNAQTYADDVAEISPGGYLLYDSTWPRKDLETARDDITVIGIPLSGMCNEAFEAARAKVLMKNVAYVGALVALLDMDMEVITNLLHETFATKQHLMDANMQAIKMGYDYATENFECPLPIRLEHMDETDGHVLIDGNTAAGLGAVYAGATVASWYPITPSTSLIDGFTTYCKALRKDPETGKNNYCIVQAPGISLMSEFLGLAYFAEIPAVLFDVQRVGPSTGMPTRTQQGDILASAYASHGDTRHVLLFPADPKECFEMAATAFDLAERLQTPVIVLSDLDIGMNDWMIPELKWDENYVPDRGKVYTESQLKDMDVFHRYVDVDGDAIPYRTLPGVHPTGAYFVRGSGHNRYGGYTEKSDEYKDVLDRLRRKSDTAGSIAPAPIIDGKGETEWAIISIGSCDGAIIEARDRMRESGIDLDYMRILAFPFNQDVADFIERYERVFVIEQNRDAQLRQLLISDLELDSKQLTPLLSYDGMPVSCSFIVDSIQEAISRNEAA